jgi:hypothetical protein
MTNGKNTKSTPKCQAMCLVSSCKISESLDQRPAFHKGISMARSNKHTCSNILAPKIIQPSTTCKIMMIKN